MDICCNIDLEWRAADNSGTIANVAGELPYFDLGVTAVNQTGASPQALLLAAVASCYSITLANMLRAACLPRTGVAIHADGTIGGDQGRARFTRVRVQPTIHGADVPRREAYIRMANAARDECLVGRAIRGNVAFVVGEVTLLSDAD